MYSTLCRPILEYACPIWNPYMKGNIERIERIQRNFTRYLVNQHYTDHDTVNYLNYFQRLDKLRLCSLEKRRMLLSLCLFYSLFHKLTGADFYFKINERREFPTLSIPFARCNVLKFSFLGRMPALWNSLPLEIRKCDTSTLFSFKTATLAYLNTNLNVYIFDCYIYVWADKTYGYMKSKSK